MWKQSLFGGFGLISCVYLLSDVPVSDLHRLLGIVRGVVPSQKASKASAGDSLWVKGFECENGYGQGVNQEYIYQGTTKDGRPYYRGVTEQHRYIYYDSACAPDTPGGRWFLGQKPDISLDYDLNRYDGSGCNNEFSILTEATAVPEGKLTLDWQWCGDHGYLKSKSVYIAQGSAPIKKETDCYFDPECSKLVDWKSVTVTKEKLFARLRQGSIPESELPSLRLHVRVSLMNAGVPEDRVDYIVDKWLKTRSAPIKKETDCYFDPECSKLVDWKSVTVTKEKLFARLRQGSIPESELPFLRRAVRTSLMKAGVPEDRVDYIVDKWLKTTSDVCSKYIGKNMRSGCYACQKGYPKRVKECLECGGQCVKAAPCKGAKDCGHNPNFMKCHEACMGKGKDGICDGQVPAPKKPYCEACQRFHPGEVQTCMTCGGKCMRVAPCTGVEDCMKNPKLVKCHESCMKSDGGNKCHVFYPGREVQCEACGKKCWFMKPCTGPCESDPTFVACHLKCMQ